MRKTIAVCVAALALVATVAVTANSKLPYAATVVAKASYTGVSSNIPTTTLYTPKVDGNYQVVVYEVATGDGSGNSELFSTISWTDDLQPQSNNMLCGPGGGPNLANVNFPIHAKANGPIQFSATYAPGTSNNKYDIYLTVIKE